MYNLDPLRWLLYFAWKIKSRIIWGKNPLITYGVPSHRVVYSFIWYEIKDWWFRSEILNGQANSIGLCRKPDESNAELKKRMVDAIRGPIV